MLQKEFYRNREDGIKLFRVFSDEGKYIRKIGRTENYREAVDIENANFFYEETNELIPVEVEEVVDEEKDIEPGQ